MLNIRYFLRPDANVVYGMACMALSMLTFAYSALFFGPISILAFYGCWLCLPVLDPRVLSTRIGQIGWVFLFPAVVLLSVAWSDAPSVTLRSGLQLLATIVCATVAARVITFTNFAKGLMLGGTLVLLYSALRGGYSFDALENLYTYVGAFASKNQLGLYASLTIVATLVVLRRPGVSLFLRIVGLTGLVLGAYSLLRSYSATSLLSTAATLALLATLNIGLRFELGFRQLVTAVAALAGMLVGILFFYLPVIDRILVSVGKSPTLTGRTDLWELGLSVFHESPLLGIGYNAFWVPGNPPAEEMWAYFGISGRSGFHFHNIWVEALAELGVLGFAVVAAILGSNLLLSLRDYLFGRDSEAVVGLLTLNVLFLMRSFAELDFFNAHTIGTFVVFYSAAYLSKSWVPSRSAAIPAVAFPSTAFSSNLIGRRRAVE